MSLIFDVVKIKLSIDIDNKENKGGIEPFLFVDLGMVKT